MNLCLEPKHYFICGVRLVMLSMSKPGDLFNMVWLFFPIMSCITEMTLPLMYIFFFDSSFEWSCVSWSVTFCNYLCDSTNTSSTALLTFLLCAVSAFYCSPFHVVIFENWQTFLKCLRCGLAHSFLWPLGSKRHTHFALQESFHCAYQLQEVLSLHYANIAPMSPYFCVFTHVVKSTSGLMHTISMKVRTDMSLPFNKIHTSRLALPDTLHPKGVSVQRE